MTRQQQKRCASRRNRSPQQLPHDQRRVMRAEFEKYERSLYPDDPKRLERCSVSGQYKDETVQIGFVDWRKAWVLATNYALNDYKDINN
jgi:hypothetical protein